MKRLRICLFVVGAIVGCMLLGLLVYDFYREQTLRSNVTKIRIGMDEKEVIRILGEPADRVLTDVPGTYWTYDTSTLGTLIDDNPNRMGHLVLEMGVDGKVVKVFDLK